ncbi:MAG: hypothetical protein PVI26_04845 [Chitinispirillia bacterium]|jgi:hypothetical protein
MSIDVPDQILEDFLTSDGFLPVPLNRLESSLILTEDFQTGAKKCAEFFNNTGMQYTADMLLERLFTAGAPEKWMEYFLFCLNDVGFLDVQIASQVLRLKCLRRILMRMETGSEVNKNEMALVEALKSKVEVYTVSGLMACSFFARQMAVRILKNLYIHEIHRWLVVFLIRSEISALKERIERLSVSIDPYNMKELARILPYMRILDENVKLSSELADSIEREAPIGRPVLTFEQSIECRSIEKWVKKFGGNNDVLLLKEILLMQHKKKIPTRSLVALSTLCRWILEASHRYSSPLVWIKSALNIYHNGRFSVDAGDSNESIKAFVENSGAWIDGTVISGSFTNRLYTQWIGNDMLTRPYEKIERQSREPDLIELIRMHINNEPLILQLLDNSKVYMKMGFVEFIATHTRSVNILSKIATYNHLFSGESNRGVPLALLKNPARIPVMLLRQFLKPSYFTNSELKILIADGTSLRFEVVQEIKLYLE